jgi:putative NADPH-quinone reductase
MRTTILMFHRNSDRSKANRALAGAVTALYNVEVDEMQRVHPDSEINVDRKVARLLGSESPVLQFPIRWYSTPLLHDWQDMALTRMFYINPCGFGSTNPFLLYEANRLDEAGLAEGAASYEELLQHWRAASDRQAA